MPPDRPWSGLTGGSRNVDLLTLLAVLRSAREDDALGLVLLDVRTLGAGWGRIQSVRRALSELRAAGKRVWAYLAEAGMHEYYLASAADRVFLAPAGRFEAVGLASEVLFLKGALDRLGIEAQLVHSGRFKSAGEALTRTDMSDEHRTVANELLDDLYGQLVTDIARDRRLEEDAVRTAFDEGPFLAAEAERRRLVDALAYPDEVHAALEERFGDPAFIDLSAYRRRRAHVMRRNALDATVVGLLPVRGAITFGGGAPMGSSRNATWRDFRRELAKMAEDPRLAAIVLRIDSPGGSGLASDLMWREIMQARRLKPVVVSMADVAASGGYFMAVAADDVTAEGGTLTGSIGVLSMKPVFRGLYDQLGLTKELVSRGNAGRNSDYVRLDEHEMRRLGSEADAFYADFVGKVAAGRGLTTEEVSSAAEGRVWTGHQALAHGLIDRIGGLEETLSALRDRLELAPDARLSIHHRAAPAAFWQRIFALRGARGTTEGSRAAVERVIEPLAPALRGERVLAVMPFFMEFVQRGPLTPPADGDGHERECQRGLRGRAHALVSRIVGAFSEPPIVF